MVYMPFAILFLPLVLGKTSIIIIFMASMVAGSVAAAFMAVILMDPINYGDGQKYGKYRKFSRQEIIQIEVMYN